MQGHEHFEELTSLAAAGRISVEEYGELQEHLRMCDSCRSAVEQFEMILEQLPVPELHTRDSVLQRLHSESYRHRFIQRASAEGIRFSAAALRRRGKRWARIAPRSWRLLGFAMAPVLAVIVIILMLAGARISFVPPSPSPQLATASAPAAPVIVQTPNLDGSTDLELAQLRQANVNTLRRLEAAERELAWATARQRALEADAGSWKSKADQLAESNRTSGQQLAQATARVGTLEHERNDLAAIVVDQQTRIHDLGEEVKTDAMAVEREKQLSAVAQDIREMMGARSLHIVDVADLNSAGIPKKSFGRVFFVDNKLLIFYAFDLSQKGNASKVTFQAWGQGPNRSPINLGFFQLEDQAQKRWVLRVDNPQLMKSVESVFVTVEPAPGREQPTGKTLLYAYLGAQANHP